MEGEKTVMPTRAEQLTPKSSPEETKIATSSCIATEIRRGKEKDQAIAMCNEMARKATGKGSAPKGGN